MAFKDNLAKCFGSSDMIFAGHSTETGHAKLMAIEAMNETDSWSDIENAIREYLSKNRCSPQHIEEQIKRSRDITNYFKYD